MNQNIAAMLLSPWTSSDKIAYHSVEGTITFRDLAYKVRCFANWISLQGLKSNDRVSILFDDCIDSVVYFLGTIWAGGIPCIINSKTSASNLSYKLEKLRSKFVFYQVDRAYLAAPDTAQVADKEFLDTACLMWSSGTGGDPKAIKVPHGPMLESVKNCAAGMSYTTNERIYCTAKFFFSYGVYQTIFTSLWCGATAMIDGGTLMPKRIEKNIKSFNPTVFLSVPAVYGLMLKCRDDTFRDVRCVSGGDILPDTLNQRFQHKFGCGIHNGLGTTETLHIMTLNQETNSGIGRPFPGWVMRLVDERGLPVAPGEIGLLEIKTDCKSTGYWEDIENTNRVFGSEWIHLGDMCIQDQQGGYHYVGRSGDLIKYNGHWANLATIETMFLKHPHVEQAVVVAATDDQGRSKITAHVVLKQTGSVSVKEIREWIKQNCEFDYYPRSIHILDKIPRNENGKIDRAILRRQYA